MSVEKDKYDVGKRIGTIKLKHVVWVDITKIYS